MNIDVLSLIAWGFIAAAAALLVFLVCNDESARSRAARDRVEQDLKDMLRGPDERVIDPDELVLRRMAEIKQRERGRRRAQQVAEAWEARRSLYAPRRELHMRRARRAK